MYDILIIGGGPAGLTAATYGCRAGKSVLVLEKETFGGQITWSPKVENFPGFVSISGAELGDRFMEQAMEQGAEVELEEAVSVNTEGDVKTVTCASGAEFQGRSLIIAAGAKPRMLGLPREAELVGSGVCFCAVCDGAFYKDKTVAVNGGGNSALQDALLLSEKCGKVYLIHRRDSFRGEAKLVEALKQRENVEFVMNSRITALLGREELSSIVVKTGEESREIALEGLFVAIGHAPDLGAFGSLIELDGGGYAASGEDCLTKTPGVFVAGDCRKKSVRQLTTAVSDGSAAALAACAWLDSTEGR
ncbi:MAG TPA: FAD-dependent oxidoreductase [Candidatus Limivicinus faecipullorum]|nr:FAD-dependent oxidoreductase [Candidatus Limivicinus faecipullorum]